MTVVFDVQNNDAVRRRKTLFVGAHHHHAHRHDTVAIETAENEVVGKASAADEFVKNSPQVARVVETGNFLKKIMSREFRVGVDDLVVLPETRIKDVPSPFSSKIPEEFSVVRYESNFIVLAP